MAHLGPPGPHAIVHRPELRRRRRPDLGRSTAELEALPEDISIIGINDYWFLDGYERVVAAKSSGRLNNVEAIFPVIEMRLDQFGGTDGDLSRVNLHVVFDPELTPDVIRAQFIGALQSKVTLSPGHQGVEWQGVITRDSLTDLGKKIKQTVPGDRLPDYGSDLVEGFNSLNVRLGDVQAVLDGHFFKGKTLIGSARPSGARSSGTTSRSPPRRTSSIRRTSSSPPIQTQHVGHGTFRSFGPAM